MANASFRRFTASKDALQTSSSPAAEKATVMSRTTLCAASALGACLLFLPVFPQVFAQSAKSTSVTRVYSDSSGRIHVVDSGGSDVTPPVEKNQIDTTEAKIAEDKQTVGWLVEFNVDDGTSYPIALSLVVYRSGKILHRFDTTMVIAGWQFVEGGKQVAFYTTTLHGDSAAHYELHDVATGRLLAQYGGHRGAKAPAWAAGLDEPE
jgi:hypothetical protein